jgi:hypothetical protein
VGYRRPLNYARKQVEYSTALSGLNQPGTIVSLSLPLTQLPFSLSCARAIQISKSEGQFSRKICVSSLSTPPCLSGVGVRGPAPGVGSAERRWCSVSSVSSVGGGPSPRLAPNGAPASQPASQPASRAGLLSCERGAVWAHASQSQCFGVDWVNEASK